MNLAGEKNIFAGPVGAGKMTAIGAVSDDAPASTEEIFSTRQEQHIKDTMAVAMDFSYIKLDEEMRIQLFGTPGQQRLDFTWKNRAQGGWNLGLLINNDNPNPIYQLEFYLDAFSDFIAETGVVIGITRTGVEDRAALSDYQACLMARGRFTRVLRSPPVPQ